MARTPSKADRRRWRDDIVMHLEDFPRQFRALEHAMAEFGDDFNLADFKTAFETADDMEAYTRVQALERATSRVQSYVSNLSIAGAKLAGLEPRAPGRAGSPSQRAFEALHAGGVISAQLSRRLTRAQGARSRIEHSYVRAPAGDVHRAANLVREGAHEFIGSYRDWIEAHLTAP